MIPDQTVGLALVLCGITIPVGLGAARVWLLFYRFQVDRKRLSHVLVSSDEPLLAGQLESPLLQEVFDLFDVNKSGDVSIGEVRTLLQSMYESEHSEEAPQGCPDAAHQLKWQAHRRRPRASHLGVASLRSRERPGEELASGSPDLTRNRLGGRDSYGSSDSSADGIIKQWGRNPDGSIDQRRRQDVSASQEANAALPVSWKVARPVASYQGRHQQHPVLDLTSGT